eukprot:m.305872 g.305872  ORF g.305872 m.305872 type:complete len:69 (+) comp27353_c0_seq11:43-249(+)
MLDRGEPKHRSATCVVVFASDPSDRPVALKFFLAREGSTCFDYPAMHFCSIPFLSVLATAVLWPRFLA